MPARITVNGELLAEEDIRAGMATLRASLEANGEELSFERRMRLREEAVGTLIEQVMVNQEIRRLGLSNPAHLVEHWGRNLKRPSGGQVREYYRTHREQFQRPECVHASHLVKNSDGADKVQIRKIVEEMRARVLAGEAFEAVSAALSDCPENGGDLGFFGRGIMVEEFDEVVFSVPVRELTPVFETSFGFHVALVHEHRPPGVLTAEEAAPEIEEMLHQLKLDQEAGVRLAELRRRTRIEIT